MSYTIDGKIHKVFPTQQITEKFRKREFVLLKEYGDRDQYITFQAIQDGCEKLDGFNIGELVNVSFRLGGREYTKNGETKYFNSIESIYVKSVEEEAESATPVGGGFGSKDEDLSLPF